jgi:hypothetical protein
MKGGLAMPGRSGRDPGDDAADQQEQAAADQQEQAAAELSNRAAESVDRRYDGTKETHIDDRAREGTAEDRAPDDDERRKSGPNSRRD